MRSRLLERCALAAAVAMAAGPSLATVYEQGTVAVAGGAPTDVTVRSSAADLPPGKTIYLTVDSGAFVAASWVIDSVWQAFWWEEVIPGEFVLNGNEYLYPMFLGSNDQQQRGFLPGHYLRGVSTLRPTLGTFRLTDHSAPFNICDSDPHVVPLGDNCAESLLREHAALDEFTVRTDHNFTWTLSDVRPPGIPEPDLWALMIGGFGLMGAALRRRPPLPATAQARVFQPAVWA